jgi:ATP-dependent DNA helicase RecQ
VLRGSKDKRILTNGHDRVSTYNIGYDRSGDQWKLLSRALLHQGLLDETTDGYSVLRLNTLSKEVLSGKREVWVSQPNVPPAARSAGSSARRDLAEALFDRLRILRKQVADTQSVAPYIVFADSSLKLMSQEQPQTLAEFAEISGVGSRKLAQYGEKFVAEIREFCQERGIPLRDLADPEVSDLSLTVVEAGPTHLQTCVLFQQGLSPAAIAQRRQLSVNTVIHHLEVLLEAGQITEIDRLVPIERYQAIRGAIERVGDSSLKVIREHLGEAFEYEEIKLVRAAWRSRLVE